MALGCNPYFRRMLLTLPSVPGYSGGYRHVVPFRKEEDSFRDRTEAILCWTTEQDSLAALNGMGRLETGMRRTIPELRISFS
jgi:hypothetical protein